MIDGYWSKKFRVLKVEHSCVSLAKSGVIFRSVHRAQGKIAKVLELMILPVTPLQCSICNKCRSTLRINIDHLLHIRFLPVRADRKPNNIKAVDLGTQKQEV